MSWIQTAYLIAEIISIPLTGFLTRVLTKTNFNVCKAARMTGIHRNTLSRKIAAYRIKKTA